MSLDNYSDRFKVPTWHRLRPEDSGSESVDDNGQKSQEWYSPRHSDDIDRKYIHLALSDTLLFGTPLALECFGGLISEYRDKVCCIRFPQVVSPDDNPPEAY